MAGGDGGARPPFGICRAVFDHWLELGEAAPGPSRIPVREQVDMLSLPVEALPWFFIHVRIGERYQVRLAGSKMTDAFGFEPTGRYLDEMMAPDVYPERKRLFDHCTDNAVPVHYRAALAVPDRQHVGFSRILVPLRSTPNAGVDMVCGTMVFFGDAQLADDERKRIGSGHTGVLFCVQYVGGRWVPV